MGQQYSKVNDDNILFYLKQITQDDKEKLFDLISTDQEQQAIQLTCELINRERRGPLHLFGVFKVPKNQCNAYGHYVYNLLKDVYWARASQQYFGAKPLPFCFK